jgi:hypothetical protein
VRLNGQPGQDRSQCDVVGIGHFNRVLRQLLSTS